MKTSPRLEAKLNKLALLARDLPSRSAREELTKVLLGKDNFVIARAARLIARAGDRELVPVLVDALGRLLNMPAGCRAKSAILEALDDLQYEGTEPFVRGISYRQMEPVYGGQVDTAADLRATCAIMLARRYYQDIYFEMARLLVDQEASPRLAAVSVLTALGSECGEALVVMRVLTGEQDPMVLRKCFSGLIAADTDRSWSFVTGFLDSTDLVLAESAAIAVGESHNKHAFPVLRETWERNADMERKSTLLLALALTRDDEAIEYLLRMIREERAPQATRVLQAISIYSADERIRERVHEAVSSRGEREVTEAYERAFTD